MVVEVQIVVTFGMRVERWGRDRDRNGEHHGGTINVLFLNLGAAYTCAQ